MAEKKKAAKKAAAPKGVRLRAVSGFGWGDEWWDAGDELTVPPKRAEFLINNQLAVKVD